jgi:serine/threonine protein kinase
VVLEMLTCKHPWQNLDEIQTLWRLGRYDKPPIPDLLSPEAASFLNLTFETDPKLRPTANSLLDHDFCISNVEDWNFKAYKEAAILKKQQIDLANEEDDDSDEDCSEEEEEECEEEIEYEDDEDEEESDEIIEDEEYDEYDVESLKRAKTIDRNDFERLGINIQ